MNTTTVEKFNPSTLKLVQGELVNTIEAAATKLEQFSEDRENGELLQRCIDYVKQIRGTLNMLQLGGVDILAEELVAHITDISLGDQPGTTAQLECITSSFFILPRYLEYCTQTGRSMAVLLIPHINELRQARKQPFLSLSHYYFVETADISNPDAKESSAPEDLGHAVRRLRHMYQVAMLNVLQEKQVGLSLGMMARAMSRLSSFTGKRPIGVLWWVAGVALEVLSSEQMLLTNPRKVLFGALDREIKRVQKDGEAAMDTPPNQNLLKELVYIIVLSSVDNKKTQAVKAAFNAQELPYSEIELIREQELLRGPSGSTIGAMTAVLQDEIRIIKNILERAAQGGAELLNDSPELVDTMKNISEILSVVGLVAPSNALKQELVKITKWQAGAEVNPDDLSTMADTLLYVESTVVGLEKMNLSDEKLAELNALSRDDVLSQGQIAEAEDLVVTEAESGLALLKRALNAYAESNYDVGHIKNVAPTLATVRGGMLVLNLSRAAKVVKSCEEFVNGALLTTDQPAAIEHLLETFADAVISLEYYLDAVKSDKNTDTKVLEVAEESLEALGYAVSA